MGSRLWWLPRFISWIVMVILLVDAEVGSDTAVKFLKVPPVFSASSSATFQFEVTEGRNDSSCHNCSISCKVCEFIPFSCSLLLLVYGAGRVLPSTLRVLLPGLKFSFMVGVSADVQFGRLVLAMDKVFCTDNAGNMFKQSSDSSFILHFGMLSASYNCFFYLIKVQNISSMTVVTISCDTTYIITRQGTPVSPSDPITFLYGN
ncbi:hypothetical protein GW17_00008757 [Ensete ventricosum]|nr:hypothetical protein GW17_00008757 [Ensete ventricosum]